MVNNKKIMSILIALTFVSLISFMIVWLYTYKDLIFNSNNSNNVIPALLSITRRRLIQLLAIIVSVVLIAVSSLSFQTITNNRILTPSILGFEAIFVITQTLLIAIFGSMSAFIAIDYLNFIITTTVMIGIVFLMFMLVLRKNKNNIILLLLFGLVVTSLASSLTHFIQTFMHPEDFLNVISITNVNINAINENLVFYSVPLLIVLLIGFVLEHKYYDVIALGESSAINLGVNYNKKVNKTLIYITISVAISTALVGPLAFLGLIAVNGAKEIFKTNKHKTLMLASSLIAIILIVGGQVVLELIKFKTPVTVIINFIGGAYLLLILVKENKR